MNLASFAIPILVLINEIIAMFFKKLTLPKNNVYNDMKSNGLYVFHLHNFLYNAHDY
jgi:hypothetical protein